MYRLIKMLYAVVLYRLRGIFVYKLQFQGVNLSPTSVEIPLVDLKRVLFSVCCRVKFSDID